MKVVLASSEMARSVLKNKVSLQNSNFKQIKIFNDQTPAQLTHLKQMRDKLKRLHNSGNTSATTKYVNGFSTIVNDQPCTVHLNSQCPTTLQDA